MRYILSAILVCALGIPAALALPTVSASAVSMSKSDPLIQVAKRGGGAKVAKAKSKKQDDGGIHPLVGSGDY